MTEQKLFYDKLNSDDQVSFLMKPIIKALQDAGGQLTKSELRDRICESDERIAEFEQKLYISSKTGNEYKRFDFKFNFALKELSLAKFISYKKYNPNITLTREGNQINLEQLDVKKEIHDKAKPFWEACSKRNALKKQELKKYDETPNDEDIDADDIEGTSSGFVEEDKFRLVLQNAIEKMSPAKFEQFSRKLLDKMGVKFTEKGVQISKDGGIDGYGYHQDENGFRTTRVVIQCKRYNSNPVGEPAINQFLGAMNKFQADYGVFITNSSFTNSAREAAREGSPITLIDGNDLIKLVIKYELYLDKQEIRLFAYKLQDFYNE